MTVTRKVTWVTASIILLALATAAAKTYAGDGPDCPHSKATITQQSPVTPLKKQTPAKATPAQPSEPAQKATPASTPKKSDANAPA